MTGRRGVLVASLVAAIAGATGGLMAQVGDRAAIDTGLPPAHWTIPPAPVRSPEASMTLMELQPGFRIELVAAEPLVQDPIALAFDERNRLWVLEWPSYNWPLHGVLPGLDPGPTPPSRLVVLKDTNGDGRMDTRTVFAQMDWPRGIQLVDGGVLVFALPDVVFLRDTDGDEKADQRQVVQTGLPIPVNPHLAPSSPSWTLDNWTYGLQVDERFRSSDGRPLALRSGRLAGQWGMSHDDYGRLFFSYNQDHIRGSLVPTVYATRNPHYTAASGIDVRIGMDNEVWPHAITPGVNRRAQLRDDGRLRVFTANSAPMVYRGDQFPDEYRGNVFVGESAGRLIRRSVLTEKDGIITGRNAYDEREFLFSNDERFRPVFTATGPDGALYVADMYRGIIEGHIFLTTFLRNQAIDRGLQHPFGGMGRIYRIVHEGRPLGTPPPPSASGSAIASWVPVLAHPNGHWRDTAQRLIVASRATSVVPAVRTLAVSHDDPRVRVHGLWTLEGLGAAADDVVIGRLGDASAHVRTAAVRIAETRLSNVAVRRAVLKLVDDPDVAVRRQVLYTLGASPAADARNACLRLLRRDLAEPFVIDAFLSGLAGREVETLETFAGSPLWAADRPEHGALLSALATAVSNEGRAEGRALLRRLSADGAGRPAWQQAAILDGVTASSRASQPATPAAAAPRDAATVALIEQGRTAYGICAACHQADGRGLPSLAPALAGSANVTGPPAALIDIVLGGRDVDPAFPSMPPLAALSDDQLAAILTYVRQAWGNSAPAIAPDAVRARRGAPSR
jgi:glucose/arabinose dehydrogenase/mono/diheme cytochrome c family protein